MQLVSFDGLQSGVPTRTTSTLTPTTLRSIEQVSVMTRYSSIAAEWPVVKKNKRERGTFIYLSFLECFEQCHKVFHDIPFQIPMFTCWMPQPPWSVWRPFSERVFVCVWKKRLTDMNEDDKSRIQEIIIVAITIYYRRNGKRNDSFLFIYGLLRHFCQNCCLFCFSWLIWYSMLRYYYYCCRFCWCIHNCSRVKSKKAVDSVVAAHTLTPIPIHHTYTLLLAWTNE